MFIVSEVKPDCDAIEVLPNLNDAYLYRIEQDE